MSSPTNKTGNWFNFRLRTLFVLSILLVVASAWCGREYNQRQREAIVSTWIKESGGSVASAKDNWWNNRVDQLFGERIQSVHLTNTRVSDLTALSELKDLRYLDLSYTPVRNLSSLTNNKRLEHLFLIDTMVDSLSALEGLDQLEWLLLHGTPVRDLSPLANAKSLTWLTLTGTKVDDLTPLMNLHNLELIRLQDTCLTSGQVQELRLALPECEIEF